MRFSEKAFQRRVALALAHLCSADDQRKIFIDHNGLELLIGLLGSSCPKAATRRCRGKPQISLEFLVHPEVAYKVYGVKPPESAVLNGRKSVGEQIYTSYYSPIGARVKCLSYAGYFINARDVSGTQHIKQFFSQIVTKHGSAGNLPRSCTSRLSPRLCFFPQYVVSQITTPIFFVNATYDSWQIKNILAPGVADPHGH